MYICILLINKIIVTKEAFYQLNEAKYNGKHAERFNFYEVSRRIEYTKKESKEINGVWGMGDVRFRSDIIECITHLLEVLEMF